MHVAPFMATPRSRCVMFCKVIAQINKVQNFVDEAATSMVQSINAHLLSIVSHVTPLVAEFERVANLDPFDITSPTLAAGMALNTEIVPMFHTLTSASTNAKAFFAAVASNAAGLDMTGLFKQIQGVAACFSAYTAILAGSPLDAVAVTSALRIRHVFEHLPPAIAAALAALAASE